jgi:hypothetical protein
MLETWSAGELMWNDFHKVTRTNFPSLLNIENLIFALAKIKETWSFENSMFATSL